MDPLAWISLGIVAVAVVRVTARLLAKPRGSVVSLPERRNLAARPLSREDTPSPRPGPEDAGIAR